MRTLSAPLAPELVTGRAGRPRGVVWTRGHTLPRSKARASAGRWGLATPGVGARAPGVGAGAPGVPARVFYLDGIVTVWGPPERKFCNFGNSLTYIHPHG